MKKTIIASCIALASSVASVPSFSSSCPLPDADENLHEEIENFKSTMSDFTEVETLPDDRVNDPDFLNGVSDGASESIGGLGEAFGAFAGFEMGVISLKKAIETHNTEQIITSSVTIGTSIGLPIMTRIITTLAGETVGEVFGGVAGAVIAEGFAIYSGVKAEEQFSEARKDNKKLKDEFKTYVDKLIDETSTVKKTLLGNSEAALEVDARQLPEILFSINQEKIDYMADYLISESMAVKAKEFYSKKKDSLVGQLKVPSSTVTDKAGLVSELEQLVDTNRKLFSLTVNKDVGGEYPNIKSSPFYYEEWDTPLLSYERTTGFEGIKEQVKWSREVARKIVKSVIKKALDKNKDLVAEYKEFLNEETKSTAWQEALRVRYNEGLNKSIAWYIFGKELMSRIDLTRFDEDEAVLWIGRIMDPLFESFVESKLDSDALSQINVSHAVVGLVNMLIVNQVDIQDDSAVRQAIDDQLVAYGGVPSSIANVIGDSVRAARSKIDTYLVGKNEIKPLQFSTDEINEQVEKLTAEKYFINSINDKIESYLADYDTLRSFPSPNRSIRNVKILSGIIYVNNAAAKMHADFMSEVRKIIQSTKTNINSESDMCKIAATTSSAGSLILNKYLSYKKINPKLDGVRWISFQSLPVGIQVEEYVKYLLKTGEAINESEGCKV